MNRIIMMRLITRHAAVHNKKLHTTITLSKSNDSSSSSDSSDSDNEKANTNRVTKVERASSEESKKQTVDLLNSLLEKMSTDEFKSKTVDRAIPTRKRLPKPIPKPTLEEKLMDAAKDAADSLGGDVKQTEAELLDKIFSAGTPSSSSTTNEASTSPSKLSLSDLLSGMKIDRSPRNISSSNTSARYQTSQVQKMVREFQNNDRESKKFTRINQPIIGTPTVPGNLYGGTRLNIFDQVKTTPDNSSKLKTWHLLDEKELKLMMTHPPENIFQELIQWTEKGLLWKFPINNEIAMEEEENIHFSEHVFVDRHLKGWCPTKGPVRHFMDLVCVGLSKNPYMTVQEKKDHIMWYRDFFGSKQELLKKSGAIETDIIPSDTTKQIETS